METTENVLQRILDEQGFVVLCTSRSDMGVGQVIPGFHITRLDKTDASVVIVGFATKTEALAQAERYFPAGGVFDDDGAVAYLKVVAE